MRLLSPWASSWVSSQYTCLVGDLLTSGRDEVLFIKAYSLKRTTIQQGDTHARPSDEEMAKEMAAAGDTEGTGEGSGSGVDGSVEKSEGHEQSLQGEPGEQERVAHIVIDEKKRTDESEKV
jgi:hypothetical protein